MTTYNDILAAANAALDRTVAAYKAIHGDASDEKAKIATTRAWKAVQEAAELVIEADNQALRRSTFRGLDLKEIITIGIELVEGSIAMAMEHPNRLGNLLREIEMILQNVFRSLKIVDVSVGGIADSRR